jgi:hypothetical protein
MFLIVVSLCVNLRSVVDSLVVFLFVVLPESAFTYWGIVYGTASWFSGNGFRVMLMHRRLEV